MNELPRNELVTLRLETMKRHEALDLAIAFLTKCTLIDCEVARILLRAMRDKELHMINEEGEHDDITKTHVSWV